MDHNGNSIVEEDRSTERTGFSLPGPHSHNGLLEEEKETVARLFYVVDPAGVELTVGVADAGTGAMEGPKRPGRRTPDRE